MPWSGSWRAPWTGAAGPGLNVRPSTGHAFPAYNQPATTPAPPTYNTNSLIQALQAASLHQAAPDQWIMDNGASSHMTGNQGNLPIYCPSSLCNSQHIIVGNGSTLPILGTGSTTLTSPNRTFTLQLVLHTPDLVANLVSVHKFTRDNLCSVEFDPYGFSMKDLHNKTPIHRSNSSYDLYPFGGHKQITSPLALSASTSTDVWHRRLGHLSSQSLSHLLSQFVIPCTNKRGTSSV